MTHYKEAIAKGIRHYRIAAGLKQQDLAKAVNVSATAVSKWESGANSIDIDKLFEVCSVLGISIETLTDWQNDAFTLSIKEKQLIEAYREASDAMRCAVDKLLDITGSDSFPSPVKRQQ